MTTPYGYQGYHWVPVLTQEGDKWHYEASITSPLTTAEVEIVPIQGMCEGANPTEALNNANQLILRFVRERFQV